MIEKIHERISVVNSYNRNTGLFTIHKLLWNGRAYNITKLGYHHKIRSGRNIFHIFHVCNESLAFKLELDTENLIWRVLEISDGRPN